MITVLYSTDGLILSKDSFIIIIIIIIITIIIIIPNLLNLSQITKSLVEKTGFFVPLPRRDVSQTPRVHSVLENPNMGPADSLNCFRLQYVSSKLLFKSLHHLSKHRVRRHS